MRKLQSEIHTKRVVFVSYMCVCVWVGIRHGIVKLERKPCLMATLACMQRHVFHPNKFSTMKTTNSVSVYVNYLESWEASQQPHRKTLTAFFSFAFYSVATFLWFSLCDNKFELCGANLQKLWLCHHLFQMLCFIHNFSFVPLAVTLSTHTHRSHSYRLKSHINSTEEAFQFVCVCQSM